MKKAILIVTLVFLATPVFAQLEYREYRDGVPTGNAVELDAVEEAAFKTITTSIFDWVKNAVKNRAYKAEVEVLTKSGEGSENTSDAERRVRLLQLIENNDEAIEPLTELEIERHGIFNGGDEGFEQGASDNGVNWTAPIDGEVVDE